MTSLIPYKGLTVLSDDNPTGEAGNALQDNFKYIADAIEKCYAEISAYNVANEITIAGIGIANKVQVTSFDTNGESLNATPDHTNDRITITKAGIYYCHVEVTADSVAGSAARFGFGVFKNNGATLFQNCHKHRDLAGGAGGNAGSVSFGGLIDLAVSDTIEVWVYNEDNTQNLSIDDITLTLIRVGS